MSDNLTGARVLLVGGVPPPFGGVSVHVQTLRDEWRARGARIHVINLGSREPVHDGVIPAPGPAQLAAALAAHAAAGYFLHVHIPGHTLKGWLIALGSGLARRPFGPLPLLTLHSGLVPTYLAASPSARRLSLAAMAAYGRVIAVNPIIARALTRIGFPAARLVVAPAFTGAAKPGAAPEAFREARSAFGTLLACAIAPGPVYGLRTLLPALKLLAQKRPSLGLVLFGSADSGQVARAALAQGVADRVRVLGPLEHAGALAAIAASDLFVRPTLTDGDALSVREALALGRPVVASAVGFRPPGTRLFCPGDPVDLAAQIEAALAEPAPAPRSGDGLEAVLRVTTELLG